MKTWQSLFAKITIFTMVFGLMGFVQPASAADATNFKDTLSRAQISTLANHTIMFDMGTGVDAGETLTLTFESTMAMPAALDFEDIDVSFEAAGGDGVCDAGDTELTLAASAAGATWGVIDTSSIVLTLTSGTGVLISGAELCIEIGTNAESVVTGVEQITNASVAGDYTLTLGGTSVQTGVAALGIIDDDTVAVSATVNPTLTFDLDTAVTDTESAASYSVALGTITTSDTRVSGTTDSINFIWIDLATNASAGAVVTVLNAGGANGLRSDSVSGDDIDSADGAVADGTEIYGLCLVAATETGATGNFDGEGDFDDDIATGPCTTNTETNVVNSLTTSAVTVLDTDSGPVDGGRAQIAVGASISALTPAHTDYTDTITFIATGTF